MSFFAEPWRMPPVVAEDVQGAAAETERAFAWDFDSGDLLMDGAGNVALVEGEVAWRQWVELALITQRGAFVIHDRLFGADLDAVRLEGDGPRKLAIARRTFAAAALQHPETRDVAVTVLDEADDRMTLEVHVTSVRGAETTVEVAL